MILIKTVTAKDGMADFIDFPHSLYEKDPNYVPELFVAQRDLFTKHPFHQHSAVQYFLAYRQNEIVGRIAAILNHRHNEFNRSNDGFFGFFECVDDQQVANLLLKSVIEWLREKDIANLIGPVNFSFNETCGLLVDGFQYPPVIMMPYNRSYYEVLLKNVGFIKKTDLLAFRFGPDGYADKSVRLLDPLKQRLMRSGIKVRKINMKDFKYEVDSIRQVYNKAWEKNNGFVPMTDGEFDHIAKDLKMILDPDFCLIAEQDGTAVGFVLAVPDFNQVLKKVVRGRLFPTGLLKILVNRRKISGIRIILLGVVNGYRKMGIEACLYGTIIKEYRKKKLGYAEASWTLEDNHLINKAIVAIGGEAYKTYRIYTRQIASKKPISLRARQ